MKISVAAVPYYWTKAAYLAFYEELIKSPVDIIYLGETVCSKRRSMKWQDWIELAEAITVNGKQAVLSTLTLLEAESELGYLRKIAAQKNYLVEANDMAAIQVASKCQNAFVAGTAINIYNERSFNLLAAKGMTRWVVPVELGKDDLKPLLSTVKKHAIELEYQVFGRLPLAYSARCFTARHHDLPKDNCQFKCLEYEQGILVKTQEGHSFAQINGIQTQSAKVSNLLNNWQELQQSGIDILRIVPVSAADTLNLVYQLHSLMTFNQAVVDVDRLANRYEFCNGYWSQVEGMSYLT